MEKTVHPILSSSFKKHTDNLTGTEIREGNNVLLMASGHSSYELRWKLLEGAKRSINIVAFSMMKDETSFKLKDLLVRKIKQGVAVRFILDAAVLHSTFSNNLLKDIEKAGGEVVRYHKVFRDWMPDLRKGHPFKQIIRTGKFKLKRRFHEKYLVVDGEEAILGGINWGDKYAYGGIRPKAWRDSDVHLKGPVVADIQHQFLKDFFRYKAMDAEYYAKNSPFFNREKFYSDWEKKKEKLIRNHKEDYFPGCEPEGDKRIRYIPHKPYDDNRLNLTNAYLLMFRNAKKYIYWGCHGIRPPRIIAETLAEAVSRGVEVRLITNSRKSSKTLMLYGLLGWMYWESSNHFSWLVKHGIHVYEWQKPGAFHSKNLVIDDVAASVGSYNVARGSTFHHTESNVIVYGSDFPEKVRKQFEIDLEDCREVTPDKVKKVNPDFDPFKRPLHERNLLIDKSLLTKGVREDLDAGKYKTM